MGAKLKSLASGTARSRWNQLLVVGFVVCCFLLPTASESKPIQAGSSIYLSYANFSSTPAIGGNITGQVLQSLNNRTAVLLHADFLDNAFAPTCYLEVAPPLYTGTDSVVAAPAPSVSTISVYVPWSVPCPRKEISAPNSNYNGNCTFSFTLDGDIQVLGNINGGPTILYWSSNTSGLGATTMDVLDSDPTGSGSIVLYNNQSEVVWQNVRNMTNQDYQCGDDVDVISSTPAAPGPAAGGAHRISFASQGLLLVLFAALLLHFLAL